MSDNSDNKDEMIKTKVWISLKMKLISLFSVLLLLTIGANVYYAVTLFKADKTAYIYETGLNKSQLYASRIKDTVFRIVDNTITLGNVLSFNIDNPSQKIKIELSKNSIALFVVEYLDNEMSVVASSKNNALLGAFETRYSIESALFLKKVLTIFDINKKPMRKINTISLMKDLKVPAMIVAVKRGEHSYYITLYNVEDLISDLKSKSLHSNLVIDNSGKEIFEKDLTKQSAEPEKYIRNILNGKIVSGSVKILNSLGIEKLVSYYKIKALGLTFITEIRSDDAFRVIELLYKKSRLFGLVILGIAIAVVVLFSLTITRPINKLVKGIVSISKGDFGSRISISSLDETRALASAFNYMAKRISSLLEEMITKHRLEKEVEIAKMIQDALFPDTSKTIEGVDIYGFFKAASECNGDWWFYEKIGRKVYFLIGDATGHGVPAALLTASARATLAILKDKESYLAPAELMKNMNSAVFSTSRGELCMTFFIAAFDLDTMEFRYCNASHNCPVKIPVKSEEVGIKDVEFLDESSNLRLGQEEHQEFSEVKTTLRKGEKIVFYTDGITEVENSSGRQLGEKRYLKFITAAINGHGDSLDCVMKSIRDDVDSFRGEVEFNDDITCFIVNFNSQEDGPPPVMA